jgi:DNA-binding transcriptional LysR family regulator
MRDPLSGLTALLSVVDKRSFAGAAAELRVSPSAVSQTIRALEQRVGVRLLQRTTRSVGLTLVDCLRPGSPRGARYVRGRARRS